MSNISSKQALAMAHVAINQRKQIGAKAAANLATFFAEQDIFDHSYNDDWDAYERRKAVERAQDHVEGELHVNGVTAAVAERNVKRSKLVIKAEEARAIDPLVLERERLAVSKVEDPNDINWRDPQFFYMTRLHKAVQDRDLKHVQQLVADGANLHIKDSSQMSPLGIASNEGYIEIASFLIEAMNAQEQPAVLLKIG